MGGCIAIILMVAVIGYSIYAMIVDKSCPYRYNWSVCEDCPCQGSVYCDGEY
jgi:hypothetical protein